MVPHRNYYLVRKVVRAIKAQSSAYSDMHYNVMEAAVYKFHLILKLTFILFEKLEVTAKIKEHQNILGQISLSKALIFHLPPGSLYFMKD